MVKTWAQPIEVRKGSSSPHDTRKVIYQQVGNVTGGIMRNREYVIEMKHV